jgi:hypothetical protein
MAVVRHQAESGVVSDPASPRYADRKDELRARRGARLGTIDPLLVT